jgi:hypothetical protein
VSLDGVAQTGCSRLWPAPSARPALGRARDPASSWAQLGPPLTEAKGALWPELPVGRCGHRDGGLQVATRLPVGGGVGGFARAVGWGPLRCVCVVAQIDDLILWQPAPSLNRPAELWLRLSCGFGFGWVLNRSAASAQTGNGAAAQMWQRLPSRHRTQCNDGLY